MIGSLFASKSFLDPDLDAWCLEGWAWLMRNLGGMEKLARTPLVAPTRAFFPPSEATGHARAQHIFDCVRTAMGMDDWNCLLEPFERRPAVQVSEFVIVPEVAAPAGTFRVEEGVVTISYASDLVGQPGQLVATFAHELAHYLVATIDEPWPGGPQAHELITELAVAYAGFGVFAANAAMDFAQHGDAFSQGWEARRSGYFSERTWSFALAIFLCLKALPIEAAADAKLKAGLVKTTRNAMAFLNRKPGRLASLRAVP